MVSKNGCKGWMQKRTNLEKTLLSLSSLLFLTLVLMILIGVTYHGNKSDNTAAEDEVCWSSDCIKTAGDVLLSMKQTTDSCSNFYDFACGKYGEEPGQTASVSKRSTESVYFSLKKIMDSDDKMDIKGLKDVRNFYNSCVQFGSFRQNVDETGEALLNLMGDMGIGIWPIIDSLYDTSSFTLEHTLATLILLGVPVAFNMEVVPDEHLSGSYLIKISPGGPREAGRSPSDIQGDVHLRSSVLTSFLLLGASSAATDVNDILSVDSSFAAIEQENSTACDDVTMLAPNEAISEMNRLMPEIDWNVIISEIRNAAGLRRPFAVKLQCRQKIRDYIVHLNDLTLRSETNYLGWRFFSKFVEHIIPTFEKSQFGTEEVVPRWRTCLELMEKFASPVLAEVLAQKMINKDFQDEVETISDAALASAQRLVSRANWLNGLQKSWIKEKVSKIRISYPFQNQFATNLLKVYIPQVEVSNFTSVIIRRHKQWVIENFKRLSQDVATSNSNSWSPLIFASTGSLSTDHFAFVYVDRIVSPYFRLHGSKWLNYGGFGVQIGREISRIMLSMNTEKDVEKGVALWNVWSRSRNSSACLDKSSTSRLRKNEEILPSRVTEKLMQDIFIDRSSIEIAYETASTLAASTKSYSLPGLELNNQQIFFLSYAQTLCDADSTLQGSEHIPVKNRLNAAFKNCLVFNEVFSCQPSSSHCQIWA